MKRPLGSYGGVIRRLQPEMSILSGPSGLQIPTCTFDGSVKTTSLNDPFIRAVFEKAFPAFIAGKQYYANADIFSGRYRRFAGSDNLPRGSYSSVCGWDQNDDGGLAREVFSYVYPEETGIVLVDDMSNPHVAASINAGYGSQFESGQYLLVLSVEPEQVVSPQWRERAMVDGELLNFFAIPCATQHKKLEKVIDLRLPVVQDWFFKIFSDREWLNIGFPLPDMEFFLELLPFLVGQRRGGNPVTQAVGRELRLWGINGLVYPSARCDAAVVLEHGDVVDWYGWNLVDYSVGRKENQELKLFDVMAVTELRELASDLQTGFKFYQVPFGQITIKHTTEGPRQGSWQIAGLEALNVLEWKKRLTTEQRRRLGLPEDDDMLRDSNEGLHPVEKLFRSRLRTLRQEKGDLGLDGDTVHHLLGRLARGLMELPFRGEVVVSGDKLNQIIRAEDQSETFKEIATGIGFLIEEKPIGFRFANNDMLEYFTSFGENWPMMVKIERQLCKAIAASSLRLEKCDGRGSV
jgi:hypothetical protein